MFYNKKKQRQALVEMMNSYRPTSKCSLKMFCMVSAKGDVKQASELYDFMIKDMEDLPMFDPKEPTKIDNAKSAITGFFDFLRENEDGIGKVYDFVRGIAASRGKNLPPIGGNTAETVAEALPNINA